MTAVVVVGGGLAGVWAAVAARRGGAEVTLIAKAPGATALYAGAVQLSPDPGQLLSGSPHHPLTRLYRDPRRLAEDMDRVAGEFTAAVSTAGLPMSRSAAGARYADLQGTARAAQAVPATAAAGELGGLRGRSVAVAAVAGIGDYDAVATAEALQELGIAAAPASAPIPDLPPGASLGDLFGHPAPEVDTDAELIAFPPGFTRLPANGFELLALVPSPHGWRLQGALEKILQTEGVTVLRGEVSRFRGEGDRLQAAVTDGGEVSADAFVLATGRFIGGGLVKSRLVSEPLLDLGVFHDGRPIREAYPRLRHLEYIDPEAAFRTGLMIDSDLRPLGANGLPPYLNLRAAGSLLGGYDYAAGGCGFGLPLLTGWLAGLRSLP